MKDHQELSKNELKETVLFHIMHACNGSEEEATSHIVNLILSERQAARVEFAKEIEHRFGRETSNARSNIARKDLLISIDRILANQDTTN